MTEHARRGEGEGGRVKPMVVFVGLNPTTNHALALHERVLPFLRNDVMRKRQMPLRIVMRKQAQRSLVILVLFVERLNREPFVNLLFPMFRV